MESKSVDKCLNIQPLLYSYVDNELMPEQFDVVSTHLSECNYCRNSIANIYKMKDMIKLAYAPKEKVDFSKKIMTSVMFNDKYGKQDLENKSDKKIHSNVSSFSKVIASKLIYISVLTATIIVAIGATITYFENTKPVASEIIAQSYDKYEDYVLEHYANSYSGPLAQASVISVNFEK